MEITAFNRPSWSSGFCDWKHLTCVAYCLLGAMLLQGCHVDGSVFAEGYTESRFASVQPGDSAEAVKAALGEPHRIVGYRCFYSYDGGKLSFRVNTKTGIVSYWGFYDKSSQEAKLYSPISTLCALTEALGEPEYVLTMDFGQSEDPNIESWLYSQLRNTSALYWDFRKIDFDKTTGRVVGKLAEREYQGEDYE